MDNKFKNVYYGGLIFGTILIIWGVFLDTPKAIMDGLYNIVTMQDMLVTDYFHIAGLGATLVNAGLCTIISLLVLHFSDYTHSGFTLVIIGLLSGFALFGKNFVNILPILAGGWLYSKFKKEPFSKFVVATILATTLAPLVTYMALGSKFASIPLGIVTGLLIGFLIPPLAGYTATLQKGLNLYNAGFCCGLFSFLASAILGAFDDKPQTVLLWAEGYNNLFTIAMAILCGALLLIGFFGCGEPAAQVWEKYRALLKTSGRSPSDYLNRFGTGATLVNAALTGIISTGYILAIGGDLNGPTLGGILTIMGFAAAGKHPFNIIPVMLGIFLGAFIHHTPDLPGLQIAALFGTTLAPISGYFGWPYGILAGLLHSCLILQTGGATGGINLYNNGFTAGLIVITIYPMIMAIGKYRKHPEEEY